MSSSTVSIWSQSGRFIAPYHKGISARSFCMQLSWGLLILILLAAAVLWFWQDSLAARESANAAAKEACNRLSLQFLDGTVGFARRARARGCRRAADSRA